MIALGGVLAACSTRPPPGAQTPIPKPPPPRPEAARPPPPPASPPAAAAPATLTGLSREQALALLGRPAAETSQAMGTVWLYRLGHCRLSLVFYPEVETEIERVLSYEFAEGADPAACLKRLRKAGGGDGK